MPETSQPTTNSPARVSALDRQSDRYSRQTLFVGIGPAGQERLRAATVAIVGCGSAARRSLSATRFPAPPGRRGTSSRGWRRMA